MRSEHLKMVWVSLRVELNLAVTFLGNAEVTRSQFLHLGVQAIQVTRQLAYPQVIPVYEHLASLDFENHSYVCLELIFELLSFLHICWCFDENLSVLLRGHFLLVLDHFSCLAERLDVGDELVDLLRVLIFEICFFSQSQDIVCVDLADMGQRYLLVLALFVLSWAHSVLLGQRAIKLVCCSGIIVVFDGGLGGKRRHSSGLNIGSIHVDADAIASLIFVQDGWVGQTEDWHLVDFLAEVLERDPLQFICLLLLHLLLFRWSLFTR